MISATQRKTPRHAHLLLLLVPFGSLAMACDTNQVAGSEAPVSDTHLRVATCSVVRRECTGTPCTSTQNSTVATFTASICYNDPNDPSHLDPSLAEQAC